MAASIKQTCQNNVTGAASGLSGQAISTFYQWLYQAGQQMSTYGAVSGIAAYAQQMSGDANIVSEFTAMTNAITATVAWIQANFPTDSQGFAQFVTLSNGNIVYTVFSAAALSGFVTQLNALIATIM